MNHSVKGKWSSSVQKDDWKMQVETQMYLRVPSQNLLGTVPRPSACSFLTHYLCIQIYLLPHKLVI